MSVERTAPSLSGKSPGLILGLLVLASLLWGSSFPIIKLMGNAVHPVTLAALRGLIGAATLIVWFLVIGEDILPRSKRETLDWIALGALNGWIANLLVNYAISELPAGQASMIQASGPLLTALAAHCLFADERLNGQRLFGIVIGFCGVALLIGPRIFGAGATPLAVVAMLGAACSYAAASIYIRWLPVADPRRLALGQQICSGLFASVIALLAVGPASFAAFGAQYPLVIALGLVATAMPVVLFMFIIRAAGPTRAAVAGYLVPAWAVILSALFLGEALSLRAIVAGIIILGGVYLVTMAKNRR